MTEPGVPLTYVACIGCGSLTDIHASTCSECQQPRPQRVESPLAAGRIGPPPWPSGPVQCGSCGDAEVGPWLVRDGDWLCEGCESRAA